MLIEIPGYTATLLAIVGAILNARRNRNGFILWIIANTTFLILNVYEERWYEAILWLFYIGISVYGLIEWQKGE